MSPPPPGNPNDADEVLSFLDRLERFLARVIQGIVVFFTDRLARWTYQVIRGIVDLLRDYFDRVFRILVKLGRVTVLLAVLLTLVVGPGVGLYYAGPGWGVLVWAGLITGAVLFALQYYLRKEAERRRRSRTGLAVCAYCRTAPSGPTPPPRCDHCQREWRSVYV